MELEELKKMDKYEKFLKMVKLVLEDEDKMKSICEYRSNDLESYIAGYLDEEEFLNCRCDRIEKLLEIAGTPVDSTGS